jgi:hypothetical protein
VFIHKLMVEAAVAVALVLLDKVLRVTHTHWLALRQVRPAVLVVLVNNTVSLVHKFITLVAAVVEAVVLITHSGL